MVGRRRRARKAAYTELLSSGGLPLIRDPALRDEVVRFYEEGLVGAAVHPDVNPNEGLLIEDPTANFLEAMGPDFEPAPHRLLRLLPDAPEWARVRGTVHRVHQTSSNAVPITGLLRESALALLEGVYVELGSSSPASGSGTP